MNSKVKMVPVGELRVSADTDAELVTVTGSCVALVLYDGENQVGGMLHVVLPGDRKARREGDREAFFADTGVPLFVEEMIRHGARRKNLKATLAGGGELLRDDSGTDIGYRNVEAIAILLRKENIPITKSVTGGKIVRRITLDIATGRTDVDSIFQRLKGNEERHRIFPENPVRLKKISVRSPEHLKMLLSQLTHLKPNPSYSELLLKAVHQPTIEWEKVRQIVSRCLVLAMHLFRIANSPYYGRPGRISSFNQALTLLGPRQLRRICVLASLTRQSGKSALDHFEISDAMLSQHCLASAVIARYLAPDISSQFREDIFTAGLFHGIGGLCVALARTESVEFSMSCGQLGGRILSEWKFPGHIVTAISSYETPPPGSNLAAFAHLGCGISRLLGITSIFDPDEFSLSSNALDEIGSGRRLPGLLPRVIEELKSKGLLEYLNLEI